MRTWHTQSWIGGCGLILATLTLGLQTAIATDISGDQGGISGQEVELLSASNDLEDTTLPTDYVLISECAGGGFSHPACRTDDGTGVEIGDKCGDLNDSCAAIDDLMCVGGKEVSRSTTRVEDTEITTVFYECSCLRKYPPFIDAHGGTWPPLDEDPDDAEETVWEWELEPYCDPEDDAVPASEDVSPGSP